MLRGDTFDVVCVRDLAGLLSLSTEEMARQADIVMHRFLEDDAFKAGLLAFCKKSVTDAALLHFDPSAVGLLALAQLRGSAEVKEATAPLFASWRRAATNALKPFPQRPAISVEEVHSAIRPPQDPDESCVVM